MKHLLTATCLCLVPVTALAEHGTQLAEWGGSSPRQQQYTPEAKAPAAGAAAAEPPAAAQEIVPAKKEEKVSAGSAVLTPEQLATLQGFFFSASIDQYMGMGTFIDTSKYANLGMWVNAFISYRKRIFDHSFSLGVQPFGLTGITYEYTMPDNPTGRRIQSSDARVSLAMPAFYTEPHTNITVTPSVNVTIPTTPESWHSGLITRLGVGLSLARTIDLPVGQLSAGLSGIASFGIFTRTVNAVPNVGSTDPHGVHVDLGRPGEAFADIAGNNPAVAAQGGAGLTWLASDRFFVSVSYGLIASWKYAATNVVDQYTPMASDTNGNPVAQTGMAFQPLQSASVSVAMNLTDVMSISLYMYNYAPLFTPDYKGVRFPWVDTGGLANNNTIIGLSLAATF